MSVAVGRSYADGDWLVTRLRAPRGAWAVLTVGLDSVIPPDPAALARRLVDMERNHATRLGTARLPRHHPERSADALAVLEACTYGPTGAVMAAPTTSRPEAPGADRQFDYRCSWLRDASLGVSVAPLLGQRAAAERYLAFAVCLAGTGPRRRHRSPTFEAARFPPSATCPGVAGWAASVPVRVGNEAANQVQYDSLGLLLERAQLATDDPTSIVTILRTPGDAPVLTVVSRPPAATAMR